MTIKEIRNEFKRRIEFSVRANTGLEDYYKTELKTFEDLYQNGTITAFTNDFLAFANGYQINTGNYDELHILQTLDLHRISAPRKVVRKMMENFLGIE